ncbi:hypothetical protein IGI04_030025, partial [Brassica rapa subsp. trilocularis]
RSPGVPPELSKGRYGHVSTHLDNPTCPSCAQGNGNEGVSNKLLSEVTLDQPARMTLYTTLSPARLLSHILVDSPHLLWVRLYSCGFATSPMDT